MSFFYPRLASGRPLPRVLATLVEPPVVEPITLTEAKLRAGLDWLDADPRDQLMRDFIAAARSKVENDTGVALLPQTYALAIEALSCQPLVLPWRPVRSATLVAYDSTGTPQPIAGGSLQLDRSSAAPAPARLAMIPSFAWPADLRSFQPWQLEIEVGHADVADLRAHAPGLLHAVGLLTAHYATIGRDALQVGHIVALTPYGYDEAIAPYQLVTLP